MKPIPFSALDFAPVRLGEAPGDALRQAVALAKALESLGYHRLWYAEHHGLLMSSSAATAVLIAHVAERTSTIRLGSGGVMLPLHSPMVIAEQFGTLELLYPGRIDLGLGRSSGTSGDATGVRHALHATVEARERFPDDLRQLQVLFRSPMPGETVRAVPGAGLNVPIWLLASSTFGARQAAQLGLPLAFATHIGSDALDDALVTYRAEFVPSAPLDRPYLMLCVLLAAAESDAAALQLFTSWQQLLIGAIRRKYPNPLEPPLTQLANFASPDEVGVVDRAFRHAVVGCAATIGRKLETLLANTMADELMFLSFIHDQAARLRSFEIAANVCARLG